MHVTLINPPQVFSKSQVTAGVVPPLGILYLSGYLKQQGIVSCVIDAVGDKHNQYTNYNQMLLRGLTYDQIMERIPVETNLIGISLLYSFSYLSVRELISKIKKKYPTVKIILGGAHSSCLPEYTLNNTEADCVVIGEGEGPLAEICRNLETLEKVKGIVYKKDGVVRVNLPREFIANLDEIPFPDWQAINLENYFQAAEPHGCSYSQRWVTIIAGRGCPYECTFCTTPLIWRRHWRVRSVENVIEEMKFLYQCYGVVDFHFEDENLGMNKDWLRRFCDALIQLKLPITWQPSNGLRAETLLSPGLLDKMKQSGCSLVVFTLESANERVRNTIIKKNLDLKSVEQAALLAKKVGIKSTCYVIIGLPGEKLKEARETINFAVRLARKGLDECVISLFSMLPGSALFNDAFSKGKIQLNGQFFEDLLSIGDLARFKSWCEHISSGQLKQLRFQRYFSFILIKALFYPHKILTSLWNIIRGRDQLKSERVLRTFLKRMIPFSKG